VLTFETWPYDRPVLVLSRQLADTPVPDALRGKVQFSGRTPKEVLDDLAGRTPIASISMAGKSYSRSCEKDWWPIW
jgi:hypothetical protein